MTANSGGSAARSTAAAGSCCSSYAPPRSPPTAAASARRRRPSERGQRARHRGTVRCAEVAELVVHRVGRHGAIRRSRSARCGSGRVSSNQRAEVVAVAGSPARADPAQSPPTRAPHLGQLVGGSTGTNRPQSGHTRGAQHTGSPSRSDGSGLGADLAPSAGSVIRPSASDLDSAAQSPATKSSGAIDDRGTGLTAFVRPAPATPG